MTREQMAQYDRFLDENDWDIYYWATQEPPSDAISSSSTSTTTTTTTTTASIATSDTSSASYAGGAEAAISEATSTSSKASSSSSRTATSEPISTGGSIPSGDAGEGKEATATSASAEPYKVPQETGEWAQTVGRFKPAYRPVPQRWRDSEILRLLRDHVKERAKENGGMAFMPPLRKP